jgi:hypothetical protein
MSVVVVHVRFPGDWEALYVQGELVAQNHSVDASDVLNAVEGKTISEARSEWNSVELVEEFGGVAPDEYSALPPA